MTLCNIIFSQTLKIEGNIQDQQGNIIAYANIYTKHYHIGTISNNNGGFFINIPTVYKNDTLCISYIGYKDTLISLSEISDKKFINIILQQDKVYLHDVIISEKKINPNNIVKKIYKCIDDNYPINNYLLGIYIRKYVKNNKTNKFVYLNELSGKSYNESKEYNIGNKFKFIDIRDINKGVNVPIQKKDTINSESYTMLNSLYLIYNLKSIITQLKKYPARIDTVFYSNKKKIMVLSISNDSLIYDKFDNIDCNELILGKKKIEDTKKGTFFLKMTVDINNNYKIIQYEIYQKYDGLWMLNVEQEYKVYKFQEINGYYYPSIFSSYAKMIFPHNNDTSYYSVFSQCMVNNIILDTTLTKKQRKEYVPIINFRSSLLLELNNNKEKKKIYWENYNFIKDDEIRDRVIKDLMKKKPTFFNLRTPPK